MGTVGAGDTVLAVNDAMEYVAHGSEGENISTVRIGEVAKGAHAGDMPGTGIVLVSVDVLEAEWTDTGVRVGAGFEQRGRHRVGDVGVGEALGDRLDGIERLVDGIDLAVALGAQPSQDRLYGEFALGCIPLGIRRRRDIQAQDGIGDGIKAFLHRLICWKFILHLITLDS